MNIIILGIGNILLSDEGAGIAVLELLRNSYIFPDNVELIDAGTMGLDILPYFDGKSHLFIVDAAKSDRKPGDIFRRELKDPPAFFRTKISPHQLGIADVLGVAAMTGNLPPHVVFYGIEPETLDTGIGVSDVVQKAVEQTVQILLDDLKKLNIPVEPIHF